MNEYNKNAKLSYYHTNKKELHKPKQGLRQRQFNTETRTHESTRLGTQDLLI